MRQDGAKHMNGPCYGMAKHVGVCGVGFTALHDAVGASAGGRQLVGALLPLRFVTGLSCHTVVTNLSAARDAQGGGQRGVQTLRSAILEPRWGPGNDVVDWMYRPKDRIVAMT